MRIKSIEVENFKNFEHQRVEFDDFNVFVGANAAGKSNFVNLIKFIKNINEKGLKKAIGELGGYKYFKNVNCPDKPFKFRIEFDYDSNLTIFEGAVIDDFFITTHIQTFIYEFVIDIKDEKIYFIDDKLSLKGQSKKLYLATSDLKKYADQHGIDKAKAIEIAIFDPSIIRKDSEPFDNFSINVLNKGLKAVNFTDKDIEIQLDAPNYLKIDDLIPFINQSFKKVKGKLILESYFDHLIRKFEPFKINLYDFNPKTAGECTIYEENALEEDGNNLPMAIKNILKDDEKKKKFHNLVSYVLPFIESINTLELPNDTILFEVKEKSSDKTFLSNLLSDGTINIIAIIVALFFEDNDVVVLEEPERFIHPSLISSVVSLLNDVAGAKQIIVSTHNSEVVRYSGVERLLMVSRDKNGTSKITRPAESENLKVFLENDLGIADLFVDNMLEGLDKC